MSDIAQTGFSFDATPTMHNDDPGKAISGFWLFMMSDLIIFSLFFATYATMLTPMSIAGGPGPKDILELRSAAFETGALLTSTFTFGLASLAIAHGRGRAQAMGWLLVTLALGLVFLGLEGREFARLLDIGAVPQRSGYLSALWGLVPLHGLHVTAGVIWLTILLVQMGTQGVTGRVRAGAARLALFWHFLDLIWIGIFSVVYLGGLA
ncbi:cytochrome c oxidase subunit 3 [Tropicimonas sp. IMCC34043]|uniref:cytochrome c oxidase subunit 3 n=1 Tax=Tropicimonas sp. IMCC34043 TaxID=2248760 RepID=UPI001E2D29F9|nr:cytochrome c oxidase subunit 3 [Tropicimonas sp. IMCC34043]